MKRMGWEQIYESTDDSYRLKWVQCTRSINWNSFREGIFVYVLNFYSGNFIFLIKKVNNW